MGADFQIIVIVMVTVVFIFIVIVMVRVRVVEIALEKLDHPFAQKPGGTKASLRLERQAATCLVN